MNTFSWDPAQPTPVEWGGACFGEVNDAPKVIECCDPSTALPACFARGPGDRIYFDTVNRHPTKLKLIKGTLACLSFGIVPGILCASISCCCYQTGNIFKDSAGEKVIDKKVGSDPFMDALRCFSSVLHFEGMTSKQGHLALVAVMYNTGIFLSTPPIKGGGGGG